MKKCIILLISSFCLTVPSKAAILDLKLDFNEVDDKGNTLLFYAGEDLEKAKSLIQEGTDVNIQNKKGDTVLIDAVRKNYNPKVINFYLDNGADPSIKNMDGKDAFMLAYEKGLNMPIMDLLASRNISTDEKYFKTYQKIKDCKQKEGWYMEFDDSNRPKECRPCHDMTGITTREDCLKCPNHVPVKNSQPFVQCASCDDFGLLASWDDGTYKDLCPDWIPDEETGWYKPKSCPKEAPIWGKGNDYANSECFKCNYLIRDYMGRILSVIRTTEEDCNKCPERTFYYGDVFYQGEPEHENISRLKFKNTPKEGVCLLSKMETPFIEVHGKKYHCRGYQPIQTTAENCAKCSEWRTMENNLCILKNRDISDWKEQERETLIKYVSDLMNKLEMDKINNFIKSGNDINMRETETGMTPLMFVAQHHNWTTPDVDKILEQMIKMGADVNATDDSGNTPLIWCLRNGGHSSTISILLKNGANVNAANNEGKTALLWAIQDDSLEDAELLLKAGADPLHKNNKGMNAVQKAKSEYMRNILKKYLK